MMVSKDQYKLMEQKAREMSRDDLIGFMLQMMNDYTDDRSEKNWKHVVLSAGLFVIKGNMDVDKERRENGPCEGCTCGFADDSTCEKAAARCPHCLCSLAVPGKETQGIGDVIEAKPGDLSMCPTCLEMSAFDDDMQLRKLNADEQQDMDEHGDEVESIREKLRMMDSFFRTIFSDKSDTRIRSMMLMRPRKKK